VLVRREMQDGARCPSPLQLARHSQASRQSLTHTVQKHKTLAASIARYTAQLTTNLTAAQASLTSLTTEAGTLATDVQALDTTIQNLQTQVESGTSVLSPADEALLQAAVDQSAAVARQMSLLRWATQHHRQRPPAVHEDV
jgi:hypothetical protein